MADGDKKFDDLHEYTLDDAREKEMLEKQNECVFMWTNKAGEPVGVVMCYMAAKGKLWLTLLEERPRVAAVRRDPRTCLVISSAGCDMKTGKTITYKGKTVVHGNEDKALRAWFFPEFAKRLHRGNNKERIAQIASFLDVPDRVIFEFTITKKIGYDGDKMAADTPGSEGGFDTMFS